jgi:hypothetical protein
MLDLLTGVCIGLLAAHFASRMCRRQSRMLAAVCPARHSAAPPEILISIDLPGPLLHSLGHLGFACRCGGIAAGRWTDPWKLDIGCPRCGQTAVIELQRLERRHADPA